MTIGWHLADGVIDEAASAAFLTRCLEDISEAFTALDGCAGVTRGEMARLEFLFIKGLDRSEHSIPNLEREIVESPRLFVQMLALTFKRSDDGEDPPEWRVQNEEKRKAVSSTTGASRSSCAGRTWRAASGSDRSW